MKNLFFHKLLSKNNVVALFLIFFLFPGSNVFTQGLSTILEKLNYGPKFGFSVSSFDNSKKFAKYRPGFVAGGFIEYEVIDLISVGLHVMYMNMGAKDIDYTYLFSESSPVHDDLTNTNISLKTLDFPLLCSFNIPISGSIKPKVFLGPSMGINLKAIAINTRNRLVELDKYSDITTSENISDRIKTTDYAAIIGVGANYDASSKFDYTIDLRYRIGFTNINNVTDYPEFSNRTIALTIGIFF